MWLLFCICGTTIAVKEPAKVTSQPRAPLQMWLGHRNCDPLQKQTTSRNWKPLPITFGPQMWTWCPQLWRTRCSNAPTITFKPKICQNTPKPLSSQSKHTNKSKNIIWTYRKCQNMKRGAKTQNEGVLLQLVIFWEVCPLIVKVSLFF